MNRQGRSGSGGKMELKSQTTFRSRRRNEVYISNRREDI